MYGTKPIPPPKEAQTEQTPTKNIMNTQNVITNTVIKTNCYRHLKVCGNKKIKN